MAPKGSDGLLSTHALPPSSLYIHVEARFPCSVFEQRTSWQRHVLVISISTLRLMYVVEEAFARGEAEGPLNGRSRCFFPGLKKNCLCAVDEFFNVRDSLTARTRSCHPFFMGRYVEQSPGAPCLGSVAILTCESAAFHEGT